MHMLADVPATVGHSGGIGTTPSLLWIVSAPRRPLRELPAATISDPLPRNSRPTLSGPWWRSTVHSRPDCHPYDAPILTPAAVLNASGHVANFADLLVDDRLSGARFRADKAAKLEVTSVKTGHGDRQEVVIAAPDKAVAEKWCVHIKTQVAPGAHVERHGKFVHVHVLQVIPPVVHESTPEGDYVEPGYLVLARTPRWGRDNRPEDANLVGEEPIRVEYRGYANPTSNNPFLTPPRPFNLLFKSHADTVDPIDQILSLATSPTAADIPLSHLRAQVDSHLAPSTVYLRPETAQGIYASFPLIAKTLNLTPPFGLAQAGKSFRNEIRAEHLLYRALEFEQLEMQYFVHPSQADKAHDTWLADRFAWWQRLARDASAFRLRAHVGSELAHYAKACTDVEYEFPWGWGELEGVANRGDYDLQCHAKATGTEFAVVDRTGVYGGGANAKYVPWVIESSAGLTRAVLAFMYDAYVEVGGERPVMQLHPTLAPELVHVLPVVGNKAELTAYATEVAGKLKAGRGTAELDLMTTKMHARGSVGKRYQAADELGVPLCVTVDDAAVNRGSVWVRHRDTREQVEVGVGEIEKVVVDMLDGWKSGADRGSGSRSQ
ncbi:hypothetical protein BCR44DRAFT_1485729 [Catenaria anguillulae PL171]|uniref:Aminoacyl-transfer RNA synthetases class-II family profile domain-containing protein n=1 Tax=Catenaria anguillulae PL171 TaxID=765915 RepID=A0A1Y2HL16_9FUNG|nr:hypothetical protein BCR44DRAFT_1485729 [Catenaria anguillulae PL171]